LKLISDYRDRETGWVSFVTFGIVAVLCFTLLFYFLMCFCESVICLSHTVWNFGLNLVGFCVDFVRLDLT